MLEAYFAGTAGRDGLLIFEPLCVLQQAATPTNLTVLHNLAMGRTATGEVQFDALRRNGYWNEGYSYLWYVGMVFVAKRPISFDGHLSRMYNAYGVMLDNYAALAFPDGSLPLPEVSADVRLPFDPLTMADDVDTPSYRVHRWFAPDGSECLAQLLVCKDANPEPRANLHYHLAAGYFALWIKGRGYIERVAPYEGFDLARNTASDDVADRLPRGALPPTWRLAPPTVGCDFTPEMATFVWTRKDGNETMVLAERQITWDAASVTVRDNGATRRYDIPQ